MNKLERRYRKLLWAYPASYRAERGDEIVGTYVDLAGGGRRWPSVGDGYDAFRGGMRERARASAATGIVAGIPAAARYALGAAVALAAAWLLTIELKAVPEGYLIRPLGPFQTLGAITWIGWLIAGAAAILLPRPIARGFIVAALAATVAVVPAAALLPYERPPLHVLVPELALGLVALGWPGRPRPIMRLGAVVVTAVAAGTATAGVGVSAFGFGYWYNAGAVLISAATILLAGSLLGGVVGALRGDGRGWWAALILLVPTALLVPPRLVPKPMSLVRSGALPTDERLMVAATMATTALVAVGVLVLTLVAHGRRDRRKA